MYDKILQLGAKGSHNCEALHTSVLLIIESIPPYIESFPHVKRLDFMCLPCDVIGTWKDVLSLGCYQPSLLIFISGTCCVV